MALTMESRAFTAYGEIPPHYTCEGADVSPPLIWFEAPSLTTSLVLIVDDPDAPDPAAPKMTWVHWVLYNIPATLNGLPEGISKRMPPGMHQGQNDWRRNDWGGPCPPVGRHRYYFTLFALDIMLPGQDGLTKAQVLNAMQGGILGQTDLVGTYQKKSG